MSNKLQNVLDEIKLEKDTYLLPENIKKDVQIFDVVGTLEEGGASTDVPVKLFETQEEMQADETAKEGDLAVVYRSEVQNWDGTSAVTSFTFPKTVVLSSAMTGNCYGYAEGDTWIDVRGDITSTEAYFRLMGNDYYDITYTSEDGLTYTRTDSYDETIVISEEEITIRMYEFSEVCGYFMRISGNTFDGLYKYDTQQVDGYTEFIRNAYVNDDIESCYETKTIYTKPLANYIRDTLVPSLSFTVNSFVAVQTSETVFTLYTDNSQYGNSENCVSGAVKSTYNEDGKQYISRFNNNSSDVVKTLHIFTIDTVNWSHTHTTMDLEGYAKAIDITDLWFTCIKSADSSNDYIYVYALSPANQTDNSYFAYYNKVGDLTQYFVAPTQLTLTSENELLPGKVAYGKNGVVTGDNSVYDNLDKEEMFLQTLGMTKQLDEERYRVYDTTTIPYTIGSYEIDIAKYISETADMENADYVLGKLVDYKTLQSITNISGIIYSQAYFAKSAVDDTYFVFVKQATDNTYHILQINATFTEIINDILVECTEAYCDICNEYIMMLRVTDSASETPYKYVVFNYVEKELVTLIPASANSYTSSTIFISDRHLTIVNNKATYLYDIKHNMVMTVGETESYLSRTDVFMFDTFIYIAKTTNDISTITRKLYKYNDLTQTVELYATYTGGSYLSMYSTTIQTGLTCIETDTYILDYGRNIIYVKGNLTSSSSSIIYAKCVVNDVTFSNALYYHTDNCISDNINYTFAVSDASAITVTDDTINTFTYSVTPLSFGKRFKRGVAISEIYDTDTTAYKLQSFEFNYSGATTLHSLTHFNYYGFNAYAEYDIKYYNEVVNDADYMLLKTSFKDSENMSIAPYLKLFNLKPVALSQNEYTEALNTVDEILGEEV